MSGGKLKWSNYQFCNDIVLRDHIRYEFGAFIFYPIIAQVQLCNSLVFLKREDENNSIQAVTVTVPGDTMRALAKVQRNKKPVAHVCNLKFEKTVAKTILAIDSSNVQRASCLIHNILLVAI